MSQQVPYLAFTRRKPPRELLASVLATLSTTVAARVATSAADSYVDRVVKCTTLSNRADDRRVVRICVDRRNPVHASWETTSDGRTQDAALSRCVQALEERKLGRVWNCSILERGDLLDGNMRVRNDNTLAVELLRRRVIVGLRVDKVARGHVLHSQFYGKRLVGRDVLQVSRRDELGTCNPVK